MYIIYIFSDNKIDLFCLEYMTERDIENLIKDIGDRIKFREALNKYKLNLLIENKENISEIDSNESSLLPRINNQNDFDCFSPTTTDTKSIASNTSNDTLPSTSTGEIVCDEYLLVKRPRLSSDTIVSTLKFEM